MHLAIAVVGCLVACSATNSTMPAVDGPSQGSDASTGDTIDAPSSSTDLGTVTNVTSAACPAMAPMGSTCQSVTVSGCPGIASESISATVWFLPATGTPMGTIVHFSGGGGEGFEVRNVPAYQAGGFQQVLVAWSTAWEQTSSGIKAAGCRPATILKWVFNEPGLHGGSRSTAFCGQGFSGGSGQLGYALAQYGMGEYLDYVNELSGPPFARIDLGCDYSDPTTTTVCGASDTMQLPASNLNPWENTTTCGTTNPPSADVAKWMGDSIAVGGTYLYPHTRVEFFDCTNNATPVTAMAQLYYQELISAGSTASYHCYSQADNCSGEDLGTGLQSASAAMLTGCVPRH